MSDEESERHYGLDVVDEDEEPSRPTFPKGPSYGGLSTSDLSVSDLTLESLKPRTYEIREFDRGADEVVIHDGQDTIRLTRDEDGTINISVELCVAVKEISQTLTVGGMES